MYIVDKSSFAKKIISVIMLFAFLFVPSASAVEADIAAGLNQIFVTATTGVPGGAAFPNVFGSEGKDLYGKIYLKVRSSGTDMALEKTAGARNLSKSEVMALLPGAFITDVINSEKPELGINLKDVQSNLVKLQQDIVEEKNLADFEVAMLLEVVPTELFANGDEGDSGFDLLTDLDIMEFILFGKTDTSFGGLNNGNDNRQSANASGNNSSLPQPSPSTPPPAQPEAQRPQPAQPDLPTGSATNSAPDVAAQANDAGVFCPVDQSFNSAVESARKKEKDSPSFDDKKTGGASGSDTSGSSGSGGSSDKEKEKPQTPQAKVYDEVLNKKKKVDTPCDIENDVFCLTVDLLYKQATLYRKSDNCIACHVEYINEILTKAMSKGMLPNKATGNLFEVPLCKGGGNWSPFSSASFNVITVPNPIVTPPNDDLILEGSFIKNAKSFWGKYWGTPDRCVDGKCKEDPKPQEEAAQRALESATESTSQSEILKSVQSEVSQRRIEQKKIFEQFKNDAAAKPQSKQYQDILTQLDTMNSYFSSFQKLFKDIVNVDEPDSPCRILRDKPNCS